MHAYIHTYITLDINADVFFVLFDVLQRWVETIVGADGKAVFVYTHTYIHI
jgi:hypothetical protein